jgi:pimeloyl-ACP methyl ester carboxylesterase
MIEGKVGRGLTRTVEFQLSSGRIAALDNCVSNGSDPSNGSSASHAGVVLLVPGFTGSKEDFTPLLRPLAAAGYRAVAIDQRGQYQSQWAGSDTGYRLEALAADLCELAGALSPSGIGLHLVGHSFGGLVSRLAVLQAPQLFADLVLMGSGPAGIQGRRRVLLDLGAQVLATQGMAALWEQLQAQSQADPKYVRLAPVLNAFLRDRFMATDPAGLNVMGTTLRDESDRTGQLAALGKRIMVLHGIDDDAWPGPVQAGMAGQLSATYRVIEAAAHSPAVENPPATAAALVEFWQSAQA